MTRIALLLLLFVVAARFFWRLVEAVIKGATGAAPAGRRGQTPVSVKMQPCPVCGTFVVPGKAISAVSQGATVHFCSEQCRAQFQSR